MLGERIQTHGRKEQITLNKQIQGCIMEKVS